MEHGILHSFFSEREQAHEFQDHIQQEAFVLRVHFPAAFVPDEAVHEQRGDYRHGDNHGRAGILEEHGAKEDCQGNLDAVQKADAVPVEVGEGCRAIPAAGKEM